MSDAAARMAGSELPLKGRQGRPSSSKPSNVDRRTGGTIRVVVTAKQRRTRVPSTSATRRTDALSSKTVAAPSAILLICRCLLVACYE